MHSKGGTGGTGGTPREAHIPRRYRAVLTGDAGDLPVPPPCHTSGTACIAVGSWRYHLYPLSHLKSLRTW
jgi:hypothetical protein